MGNKERLGEDASQKKKVSRNTKEYIDTIF